MAAITIALEKLVTYAQIWTLAMSSHIVNKGLCKIKLTRTREEQAQGHSAF